MKKLLIVNLIGKSAMGKTKPFKNPNTSKINSCERLDYFEEDYNKLKKIYIEKTINNLFRMAVCVIMICLIYYYFL